MKSINFKELKIYSDFKKTHLMRIDAREAVADMLYNNANGVVAANLSLKIINSEGDIEITDVEEKALINVVNSSCSQNIIDGVSEALKNTEDS